VPPSVWHHQDMKRKSFCFKKKRWKKQFVEYQNGAFVGLTEEDKCAQTVLTFMVQSLFAKATKMWCA